MNRYPSRILNRRLIWALPLLLIACTSSSRHPAVTCRYRHGAPKRRSANESQYQLPNDDRLPSGHKEPYRSRTRLRGSAPFGLRPRDGRGSTALRSPGGTRSHSTARCGRDRAIGPAARVRGEGGKHTARRDRTSGQGGQLAGTVPFAATVEPQRPVVRAQAARPFVLLANICCSNEVPH